MGKRIVCSCMEVTEDQIIDAILSKNCRTFEDIQRDTQAGTICGACEEDINEILNQHKNFCHEQ